jgi:hypothetical protein
MKPQSQKGRGFTDDFIVPKKRPPQPTNEPVQLDVVPEPAKPETLPKATPSKLKKRWKKFRLWFLDIWQPLLITISVGLVICTLLGFQIGSLNKGLSPAEQQYIASIKSGKELLSHPSFLIHKLPTYVLFKLGVERIAYYRLISAAIGAAAVLSGFYILKRWYSLRVAILGSWLLLTSAWLLHNARLATPEASFLLLMPLLWTAVWMYTTTRRRSALTTLFVISTIGFYVPGFLWLVLGAVIWQRKTIYAELKLVPWWFKLCAALGVLIGLGPLFYGVSQNQNELLLVAGLPDSLPKLSVIANNLLDIPLNLVLRGPDDPSRWLGRLPLLDIFSSTMLALGIYSLRYHLLLIRAQLLVAAVVLLSILIVIGGHVTITALLPIAYLLIAGGIAFMLQQWFVVFPRNPIARSIATTLMSVLVLMVSYYHISHYFIAWPQTPATKSAFGQSLLK